MLGTKLVLVLLVDIYHITKTLIKTSLTVMEKRVASYRFILVDNCRTTKEL